MNLSVPQVQRFWREWAKACKVMGWTPAAGLSAAQIDAKRKEFLAQCGFNSLTLVDRTAGFTKVLHGLIALQGASVDSAMETVDPSLNRARVLRTQILTELIPCLELYVADVRGYIAAIMEDKNRWWKIDRPAREIEITDLSAAPVQKWDARAGEMREFPSPLEQLQYTLAARLNAFRNKAGDTIHMMKTRAGVPCGCRVCCQARIVVQTPVPPLPVALAPEAVKPGNPF